MRCQPRPGSLGKCWFLILSICFVDSAQSEDFPLDSSESRIVATEIFLSRLSALVAPFSVAGDELTEEEVLQQEAFHDAINFFEKVTKISSGLDPHAGFFPFKQTQLQIAGRRWMEWQSRNKNNPEANAWIYLIDRDIKSQRKAWRDIKSNWLELGDFPGQFWISFDMSELYGYFSGHGGEIQERVVSIMEFELSGRFLLLQWLDDSQEPLVVKAVLDELPHAVTMGFWSFKENGLLGVHFSMFSECFPNNGDDRCPVDYSAELTMVGKSLTFLGARFERSHELINVRNSFFIQGYRLGEEHQRCLLWLR